MFGYADDKSTSCEEREVGIVIIFVDKAQYFGLELSLYVANLNEINTTPAFK